MGAVRHPRQRGRARRHQVDRHRAYPPEILRAAITQTPLKRAGTVDEVAAAIVFLASPAAAYITGTTLRIDGGQALWGNTWELPE